MRKRRRSTVGNIWQLRAVMEQEIDDDAEFIANAIKEDEEKEPNDELNNPQKDFYTEEGPYRTHF